jgi:hypothetical protein
MKFPPRAPPHLEDGPLQDGLGGHHAAHRVAAQLHLGDLFQKRREEGELSREGCAGKEMRGGPTNWTYIHGGS